MSVHHIWRAVRAAAPHRRALPPPPTLVALYDGSCPICASEIKFLRSLPRAHAVRFENIMLPTFNSAPYGGRPLAELASEMCVYETRTGALHTRVGAFRELYAVLGLPRFVLAWTRVWPFSALSDAAYAYIAANKHRLARFFPPA
jgi:predicted DCC family thiol-disulfide oxidoreductase YuxK